MSVSLSQVELLAQTLGVTLVLRGEEEVHLQEREENEDLNDEEETENVEEPDEESAPDLNTSFARKLEEELGNILQLKTKPSEKEIETAILEKTVVESSEKKSRSEKEDSEVEDTTCVKCKIALPSGMS